VAGSHSAAGLPAPADDRRLPVLGPLTIGGVRPVRPWIFRRRGSMLGTRFKCGQSTIVSGASGRLFSAFGATRALTTRRSDQCAGRAARERRCVGEGARLPGARRGEVPPTVVAGAPFPDGVARSSAAALCADAGEGARAPRGPRREKRCVQRVQVSLRMGTISARLATRDRPRRAPVAVQRAHIGRKYEDEPVPSRHFGHRCLGSFDGFGRRVPYRRRRAQCTPGRSNQGAWPPWPRGSPRRDAGGPCLTITFIVITIADDRARTGGARSIFDISRN
jgi:hypothetical protein